METKNTPLLFQQELNTFYKDILNCEIVHPPYWAGRVPETFFLRKRKWINPYQDWLGDEVIDYIKFDWAEYAMVKTDSTTNTPHIKIKKWLNTVDTSSIATIINTDRYFEVTQWTFDEDWTIQNMNCMGIQFSHTGKTLYIFSQCNYLAIDWSNSTEVFVTKYELATPYNINPQTIKKWYTYRIAALSQLSNQWNIHCKLDEEWRNIYWYAEWPHKFFQIKLWTIWDFRTLSNTVIMSELALDWNNADLQWVKWISISRWWDTIFFVNNTNIIWSFTFHINDIESSNSIARKEITSQSGHQYVWVAIDGTGLKMYTTYNGTIYQLEWTSANDVTSFDITDKSVLVTSWADKAQDIYFSREYILVWQDNTRMVELAWEHAKTITTQNFNANVFHSFKRDFQSCKGNPVYWDWTLSYKITWSVDSWVHKLTPTVTTSWTTNWYAGMYVMIFGWATTAWSTTWVGWWQIFQIKSNTATYLTVAWWDTKPNESTYAIFRDFWEVLTFIGADGLYSIHSDTLVSRCEWLNNKDTTAVVDATWNNGRIFAVLTNWLVACSATQTSSWENALYWWQYAGFFNWSSTIWNVTWAMRIVPFKEITIVFTKDSIYVIKSETMSVTVNAEYNTSFSADTYPISLAFDFVWLLTRDAVCAYNTWIYFVSDKKEFLSLNIEESYYNKYKITTEDLGIDIQQWMDWIKSWDTVSIGIDTKTIYITWFNWEKSTIFQYDTYYSFRHRWETALMINKIRVDTNQTYMGYITYRYWLTDEKVDCYDYDYIQHLRWFNWDTDIFSLKTILYHKLYMWVNTTPDTKIIYRAMLSDWLYKYELPLNQIKFLQKAVNLKNDWILWHWILWFTPLGWKAEDIIIWEYLSEVDVLEAPLWFTYSLLEITVEWDFETGGNILWTLVHDPHLTAYEDVIPYVDEN